MRTSKKVAGVTTALGLLVELLPGCKGSPPAEAPAAVAAPPPQTAGATAPAPAPMPTPEEMAALHAAAAAAAPPPVEEQARQVLAYQLTWKKVEGYAAALAEIKAAGAKDKKLMDQLREPAPAGETPPQMARRIEGMGPIKAILARHGLEGMDLLLLPQAVMSGRNAVAAERTGTRPKPEEVNASSLELHHADYRRMDRLTAAFMADQRALAGR